MDPTASRILLVGARGLGPHPLAESSDGRIPYSVEASAPFLLLFPNPLADKNSKARIARACKLLN